MNKFLFVMLSSSLLMMSCSPTNKKSYTVQQRATDSPKPTAHQLETANQGSNPTDKTPTPVPPTINNPNHSSSSVVLLESKTLPELNQELTKVMQEYSVTYKKAMAIISIIQEKQKERDRASGNDLDTLQKELLDLQTKYDMEVTDLEMLYNRKEKLMQQITALTTLDTQRD